MEKYLTIGTVVTIVLFLVTHLGLAIWFASKVSAKVDAMAKALEAMAGDLKGLAMLDKRLAVLEERMSRSEMDMREVLKAAAVLGRSST